MSYLGIFDVDGTIVAGQLLPTSAIDAIRSFREKGNRAIFFTGRPYSHIDKRVTDIGFDGCICTMGAYIKVGDEVIQNLKPAPEDVKKIVEIVRKSGLDSAYESGEGITFEFHGELPGFLGGLKKHFEDIGLLTSRDVDAPDFTFDKLCLWKNDNSAFETVEEELGKYLERVGKKENMEEWAVKGLSTRESIEKIKKIFGIGTDECYAFGDSITDLPILNAAAHTVAMGQGSEELKTKVEYVTAPIDEDGLAKALSHFGLA